jgi:hypothetical protein
MAPRQTIEVVEASREQVDVSPYHYAEIFDRA